MHKLITSTYHKDGRITEVAQCVDCTHINNVDWIVWRMSSYPPNPADLGLCLDYDPNASLRSHVLHLDQPYLIWKGDIDDRLKTVKPTRHLVHTRSRGRDHITDELAECMTCGAWVFIDTDRTFIMSATHHTVREALDHYAGFTLWGFPVYQTSLMPEGVYKVISGKVYAHPKTVESDIIDKG